MTAGNPIENPGSVGLGAERAIVLDHGEVPVVVGTAGHVDHGKSALVRALTGTDPDRLPQEKERGITIELGFAELSLPSGRVVGLVDVPGHGHYVRSMVAGVTGIDVAVLVIAADDGVMPQTREHLRILSLLGVRHMVVALTKSDLVEPDWLDLVALDVEDYLAQTPFAGSPVAVVSSKTGEGVEGLRALIDEQVDAVLAQGVVERRLGLPGRLPVDRVFNVSGVGTVVTGTLRSGSFAPGDSVALSPSGRLAKVRGVQVHNRDVTRAYAGQRTALNLVGVSPDDVSRGDTVAAPGSLGSTDHFDACLQWLGREGKDEVLVSGERVHVCVGTDQCLGRVLLLDGATELACDSTALVQIRTEEPLSLRSHDRFVIMSYSPVELVGGGEVLWTGPARRTNLRRGEREMLEAVRAGEDGLAVESYLVGRDLPVTCSQIAESLDMPTGSVSTTLDQLERDQLAVGLRPKAGGETRYLMQTSLAEARQAIRECLRRSFESGETLGLPLLSVRDRVMPRADDEVFGCLAEKACLEGDAVMVGANLVASEYAGQVIDALERDAGAVLAKLEELGIAVPFDEELADAMGMAVGSLKRALRGLCERGEAEEFEKSYHLGSAAAARARETVRAVIEAGGGSATTSAIREALGLSRKYALPLLEHLDKVGFTVRTEDGQGRRLSNVER